MNIDFLPQFQRTWVAAATGAGTAAISLFRAGKQDKQAKKLAAENPFAEQSIPQGVLDATKLAEIDANTGLPRASYVQAQQGIARNTNAILKAASDRRGALSNIGAVEQNANDAQLKLDATDANMKNGKVGRLISAKENLGQWQNNVWDWNKRQRYIQNAAAVRGLLGAANANFNNGLDRATSGVIAGVTGGNGANGFSNMFGNNNSNETYAGEGNVGNQVPTDYADYYSRNRFKTGR